MTNESLLRRMFERVDAGRYGITWKQFCDHFADWKIHPFDGYAGAVVQRGPEVHIVFFSDPKGSIRGHLVRHLQRVIDEFGHAETLVESCNEKSMRFCRRLGFVPVEVRGGSVFMRCAQFAYSRQKK